MLFYFGHMTVVFLLTPISSTCNLAEKCLFETEETFQDCSPGNHSFYFFKNLFHYFFLYLRFRPSSSLWNFWRWLFFQKLHTWAKAKEAITFAGYLDQLSDQKKGPGLPLEGGVFILFFLKIKKFSLKTNNNKKETNNLANASEELSEIKIDPRTLIPHIRFRSAPDISVRMRLDCLRQKLSPTHRSFISGFWLDSKCLYVITSSPRLCHLWSPRVYSLQLQKL